MHLINTFKIKELKEVEKVTAFFLNKIQLDNESIGVYAAKLKSLVNDAFPVLDDISKTNQLIDKFAQGLKNQKVKFIILNDTKTKTFEELVDHTRLVEENAL